mmetsp:Transcript_32271/g.74310  ORF Transcript_32271/g.74310 Transcript_32271/m.74310 type:complete len:142 (-) Transcript_32271:14-439(-)
MLVLLATESLRMFGLLASGTDGRFVGERFLGTEGLPVDHAGRERLLGDLAVGSGARFVQSDADISRGPWQIQVTRSDTTDRSRLVILLAVFAHGKPTVGKFYVQNVPEFRRTEGQNVAVHHGLGEEQLLQQKKTEMNERHE